MPIMLPNYPIKDVVLDQSDLTEGCLVMQDIVDAAKYQLGFDEAVGVVAVTGDDNEVYVLDVAMVPIEDVDDETASYIESLMGG